MVAGGCFFCVCVFFLVGQVELGGEKKGASRTFSLLWRTQMGMKAAGGVVIVLFFSISSPFTLLKIV